MNPPVIGLTLGDPAGVGPEITVAALADPSLRGLARLEGEAETARESRRPDRSEGFPTIRDLQRQAARHAETAQARRR